MNRRSRDFDTNQRNLFNAGDSRGIRLGTAGTSLLCLLFLLAACVEPYRPLDGAATLEPLTVEETAPAPDAVDVSVDTEISLTLSRSADPASVTPDSLVLMGPRGRVDVEITVDDVELFMRPNAPLIEGAVHKVIARKSIKDTFGIGLSPDGLQAETDYSFSFVTLATPPFVTAVSPPDGEQDVVASPPTPVLVTFSEPLDQASVGPRCVGVFDGHDLVSAGVECDDDECSSVKVEPMAPWREGRVHEVRVSRRCTDLSGITPAEVFTSTFSTGRVLPEVVSTVPEQGAVGVPVKGLVATFQASKALDASTIEEWNVAVSPPAPFRVAYDEEAMKIEVRLDSVLISNVSYTLTILDEVADIFGNRLGEPFTLTFVTAADPDNNPPGPISDLSHEISDRRTLSLSWTAPGGDTENGVGKGEAARYEIRRSKEPIFDWDAFEAAEPVPEEAPEPSTAGEREQLDLAPGLNVAWHYVVAAFDSAGNSRMSGSVLAAITLHEERWSPDDAFASAGRSLSLTDLFGDGNFALLVGVPGHDRVYVFPGTPSGPDLRSSRR